MLQSLTSTYERSPGDGRTVRTDDPAKMDGSIVILFQSDLGSFVIATSSSTLEMVQIVHMIWEEDQLEATESIDLLKVGISACLLRPRNSCQTS